MWLDNDSDGCMYDTKDCANSCFGCDYGKNKCKLCGNLYFYPDKCECSNSYDMVSQKEIERRKKISESLKGKKRSQQAIEKTAIKNKGKKRTKEQNEANRERAIKYFQNNEARESARLKALKQWENPEIRAKCSEINKINAQKEHVRDKIKQSVKKLWENEEYRNKLSNSHKGQKAWNKGVPMTESYRENMIKAVNAPEVLEKKRIKSKKLWEDENYVRKLQAAYHIKPNKPETILLNLLNALFPEEWKYTGDLSMVINGKCPDFVNCNGQKKIIEMFGDYWHKGEKESDRAACFSSYGYETLVIWEKELKNIDKVKNKIIDFANKNTHALLQAVKP